MLAFIFVLSVHDSYYTALSYVIHDIFVLLTSAEAKHTPV